MSITVDNIQGRVASIVDQDQDTSNIDSGDYALRLDFINRRERMWAEAGKWNNLVKEFNSLISTSTGNTSIALPADFRALAGFPKITFDGNSTSQYTEIKPQDEGNFDPSVDKYVKILGNPYSGYTMVGSPGTANKLFASGASVKVIYFSIPTSHASPANVVTCSNPEYLIQGVIADFWESRDDPRYQNAKVEANLILQNMLEFENTPSEASYDRNVKTIEETRYAYRWGK